MRAAACPTTCVTSDVRDADAVAAAMTDVDVVFQQAGLVSVSASVDDPQIRIVPSEGLVSEKSCDRADSRFSGLKRESPARVGDSGWNYGCIGSGAGTVS